MKTQFVNKIVIAFINQFILSLFLILLSISAFSQASSSANFTANVTSGCIPLTVNFINNSGNATNYIWNFDNGATSTLQNPSAVYTQAGTYSVTLIAQNATSSDTIILPNFITVLQTPTPDFQYLQSGTPCEDDNIYTFQNTSLNALSYLWDFGDGNTSVATNPVYTYTTAGTHVINLIATNSQGCTANKSIPAITVEANPIITATVDADFWCDTNHTFIFSSAALNASNVTWDWDFGDGNSMSTPNTSVNHKFGSVNNFNVYVSATTTLGCTDTVFVENILIYNEPISSINIVQASGCQPFEADFDLQTSANFSNISWDFGDGTIVSGDDSISHIYNNNGNYNVTATITDSNLCQFTTLLSSSVMVSSSPTAQYTTSNTAGCLPLTTQFTSSTSIGNSIVWNFGDSTNTSNQTSPSHTYITSGIYYPTLTVSNSSGCSANYVVDTINSGITDADFTPSVQNGCAPLTVNFTSISLIATNYFWDFGDGKTSTLANPSHVFDSIGIYDVTMICWDNNGCVDTVHYSSLIEIFNDPIILPNTDTILACAPYVFQPNAQNIGQTNWLWDFGDGTTAQGSNPSHTYQNSGNYNVKLTSYSPNGCMYEIDDFAQITIDGMNIDLSIYTTGCDSAGLSIINNSSGIVSGTWDFGDGNTSNDSSQIDYTYSSAQSTVVTYTVTSVLGCVHTQYIPVIYNCNDTLNVPPAIMPMPNDSSSTTTTNPLITPPVVCGPKLVNLYSPYQSATTFYWDFGDGSTSNNQNPTHNYNQTGTFDLIHYAYHSSGKVDTMIILHFVSQQVINPNFSYVENIVCNNSEFIFTDLSVGAISWFWDFGSGNTSTNPTANHTFPLDNTIKNVSLTVTDTNNCSSTKNLALYLYEPVVSIDYDSLLCFGDTLFIEAYSNFLYSYSWDMGDGTSSSNQFLSHVYQTDGIFPVTLNVIDAQNCSRSVPISPIDVLDPVSTFTPNANVSICKGDSIDFSADNQNADYYYWYLHNNSLYGPNYSNYNFTLLDTGIYDLRLRVQERGCASETTVSQFIKVSEPDVSFTYNQLNGCLPISVNFIDSSSNAVSWLWSFGDGTSSSSQNPSHTYSNLPNDSIRLEITDVNGCIGSYTKSILQTLNADFTVSDTIICSNNALQFSSTSNVANIWLWDFGDGNSSVFEHPLHSYQNPGIYTVTLSVSDGQGCTDTIIKQALIEVQEVNAQFTYSSPTNCPPVISSFNNSSTGATLYQWNFGDSSTSHLMSPSHIYTAAGTYDITLIATNDIGCSDTIQSTSPIVIPGPVLNYTINAITACDSLSITIQNLSINAINSYWDFGDGGTSTLTNPTHTYTSPGTYIVTLISEDSSGCQSFMTYSQPIEILNSPVADFTISDTDICIPAGFGMTNNSQHSTFYQWSYGQQSSSVTNANFLGIKLGQQNVQLIATNQIGCADTAYQTITGHYQPALSITNPSPICKNEGVSLIQYNYYPNMQVTWSGNGLVNNNTAYFDPLISGNSTTIYASTNGICASSDSIVISLVDPPDATIITADIEVCEGASISTLQANQNGIWLGQNVHPLTGAISSTNLIAGNYTISHIVYNATCSDTDNILLTVLPQSDASINPYGLICSNENSINLLSVNNGGTWSGNNINSNTGEVLISNLYPGYFNYYYNISGDCPSVDSIEIEVVEFLEASIIQQNGICEGYSKLLLLDAKNTGGTWSGDGVFNASAGSYNFGSYPSGTYNIIYQTPGLCNDIDTAEISVFPNPEIDFFISQDKPCLGSGINIENNSTNINNETFIWSINDSIYSSEKEPILLLELGSYIISVIVENQYGCKTTQDYYETINVYDTVALPSPEIIRSTVINDMDVYTEWDAKQTFTNIAKEFVLFKSTDQVSYEYITTLESDVNYYTDVDVDVYSENYTYYIVSFNQCDVPSSASNISSSVLLGYDKPNEFQTHLKWTSYEKWKNGVNRYEIQKLNEFGQWEVIKVVNHNVENTIIDSE